LNSPEKLPGARCGDSKACRVKNLEILCGGVFPERPRKTKQGRVREEKLETLAMTFTGTLIEELMATVERAEQRAQTDEPMFAEPMFTKSFAEQVAIEPWFASAQQNADYDSKLLGVA
jgi:hypothetical protein